MAVVAEFWRGPQQRALTERVQRAAFAHSLERSKRAGLALPKTGKGSERGRCARCGAHCEAGRYGNDQ
jgi:hypothetical protein